MSNSDDKKVSDNTEKLINEMYGGVIPDYSAETFRRRERQRSRRHFWNFIGVMVLWFGFWGILSII